MEISLVFLEYVGGDDAGKVNHRGLECHEITQPISWDGCSWGRSALEMLQAQGMGAIYQLCLLYQINED